MTQAEKAKRYDEVIEELRGLLEGVHEEKCEIMEEDITDIFPELKESKDEKIMKLCKELIESTFINELCSKEERNECISWIEKQCEHANFRNKIQIGDKVTRNEGGVLVNISQLNRIAKKRKKQGEQKQVVKMKTPEESLGINSETYNEIVNDCIFGENKPKVKIGDWIVSSVLGIAHIIGVHDSNKYQLEYIDGEQKFSSIDYVNYEYDKWTIQDAKDGDVLAADQWSDYPSSFVAIYKKQNEEDSDNFDSYCFVGFDGKFYKNVDGHSSKHIHPATKKQRDLIFKKMHEAGYEWDEENKELNKINEQHLISNYFNAEYERGKADALKSVTWSEEDEDFFNDTIAFLKDTKNALDHVDWIKSLKQRICG